MTSFLLAAPSGALLPSSGLCSRTDATRIARTGLSIRMGVIRDRASAAPSPLSSTLSSYVDGLKCPNPSAGEPSSITSYIQSLEETSPLLTGTASTLTDYICDLIEEGSAAAPPITSLTSYVEAVEAELPEEIEPSVSVPGSSLSSYIENVEDLADDAAEDDAEDDAPCGSLSCYLDELDERCDPFA